MGCDVKLELEWHMPFPADWDKDKRERALEKLVEYATQGTIFETRTRMKVTDARAAGFDHNRFLQLTLEN